MLGSSCAGPKEFPERSAIPKKNEEIRCLAARWGNVQILRAGDLKRKAELLARLMALKTSSRQPLCQVPVGILYFKKRRRFQAIRENRKTHAMRRVLAGWETDAVEQFRFRTYASQ
jgi:hypothetical protein